MARKRDRAIAGFFAIIFIISSCALTIAVIYAMVQGEDNSTTTNTKREANKVDNSNKLQGKPMSGFTPNPVITKLEVQDTTPGEGKAAQPGDTVTVDYTGAVAKTGIVFESSKDTGRPATFPLSDVIAGWSQGIPGMKEGGTRRLLIPASLAYGSNPPPNSPIPPNADLVFDVTLLKVGE